MTGATREPFSAALIDALISRLGLTLDEAQREELHASSVALDRVLARLQCYLPRAVEPAHGFSAVRFVPETGGGVATGGLPE